MSTVRQRTDLVNGVVGHQVLGVSAGSMGCGYRTTPASVASTRNPGASPNNGGSTDDQ